MKAGRELDALIAEKVMGHKCSCGREDLNNRANPYGIKGFCLVHGSTDIVGGNYSTNIADAWEVVEKLGRWRGFDFMLVMPDPEQTFHLHTYEAGWYEATNDGPERRVVSDADTAPLAICLAALKAKGVTHE